jgi:hypothetical protein
MGSDSEMPVASDEEMADDEDYYYSEEDEDEGEGDDGYGSSAGGGGDGASSDEDLLAGDYEGREAEGSEAVSMREQVSRGVNRFDGRTQIRPLLLLCCSRFCRNR